MSLTEREVNRYGGQENVTDSEQEFDFNTYATKKTVAKGILNIGLLTSNASQLNTVLGLGSSHQYFCANLVLIAISVLLQVVVGIMLLVIGCNKGQTMDDKKRANVLNNVTVGVVAVIMAINVFITAFVAN